MTPAEVADLMRRNGYPVEMKRGANDRAYIASEKGGTRFAVVFRDFPPREPTETEFKFLVFYNEYEAPPQWDLTHVNALNERAFFVQVTLHDRRVRVKYDVLLGSDVLDETLFMRSLDIWTKAMASIGGLIREDLDAPASAPAYSRIV